MSWLSLADTSNQGDTVIRFFLDTQSTLTIIASATMAKQYKHGTIFFPHDDYGDPSFPSIPGY